MTLRLPAAGLACLLTLSLAAQKADQDKGTWRAVSNTARSVTGDLTLGDNKLFLNFSGFPVAEIRPITAEEGAALFEGANGAGYLYKLGIRGDKTFLHKNRLCSDQDTQWMVTFAFGKQLQVAFFSNLAAPKLTAEALAATTDLCGTYTYGR